jgi:hypothetical protein
MNIKVRNEIIRQASGGLILEQAWLQYADGPLIRSGNLINLGEKIQLHLVIHGWEGEQGQIRIGAAEKLTTDEGMCFLDEQDLFAGYESLPLKAVEKITLPAVVDNTCRLSDYFKIEFKVYSKINVTQFIQGYYLLHI